MRLESASMNVRNAIERLLHVHALTHMHRASDDVEHAKTALGWFDCIETAVSMAREDLQKTIKYAEFVAEGAKP